jgi:hypothetical protein
MLALARNGLRLFRFLERRFGALRGRGRFSKRHKLDSSIVGGVDGRELSDPAGAAIAAASICFRLSFFDLYKPRSDR